jgi:hypothetical protein
MTPPELDESLFQERFARAARRVRFRLLTSRVLSGLAIGAAASVVLAALLWWMRSGELRPWSAALAALGALGGFGYGIRRRWSDSEVALYLDAKLGTHETLSTAVEVRGHPAAPTRDAVLSRASSLLAEAAPQSARPRVFSKQHLLAPVAGAALAWLSMLPLPAAPAQPAAPTGAELVRKANVPGLERIIGLEHVPPRDALQKERLAKIAEEARRLKKDLQTGIEKRDAQARIAMLRDQVAAERLKLGDGKNRPGLEAAVGKLEKSPATRDAAKALGNGDLTAFDREMQKLANQVEERHRKEAKRALEEAAKAARERGARELADALREQQKLFEARESRAEALRELAEALKDQLSEDALNDLREFGASGDPEAQKRLADAMSKALEGLSEDERKRLAEKLQKRLQGHSGALTPMTKEQLEELAKRLATPEGRKQLEQQLKELVESDPSDEAERERRLEDAERGGAEAERGLSGVPLPIEPGGGQGLDPKGDKKGQPGSPSGGPGKDRGQGDHRGQTRPHDAPELRAKANAKLNPGARMHDATLGRTESRPGETARQRGLGALGSAGPAEVGGVEGADVPEEYREQVGRYFQP